MSKRWEYRGGLWMLLLRAGALEGEGKSTRDEEEDSSTSFIFNDLEI